MSGSDTGAGANNVSTANWVPLEGATNVRDVGGWASADGGRIRTGALYRADRLSNLTPDDQDELAGRGIRTVVDFRAADEIKRDPSRLWAGVTNFVSLPIAERNVQPTALLDRILAGQITSMSEQEMQQVYMNLLLDNAAEFARFVTLAADTDNWPMLYHCTAGKDRTGIATALVMELCGVNRSLVLDEYCVTNEQRSKKRMAELADVFEREGINMEDVKPLLTAPRAVLAGALATLDAEFGDTAFAGAKLAGARFAGAAGFLLTQGEMDPAVADELRINLLI